ncbi:hypothetical protein Chor_000500 [Crotalus horridus]
MGTHCSDPVPEEQTVTKYWYDVSVLVKMDFSELNKVDPKLLNHSRLLHSMITGALWPMNISVYHIQTKSETYAETLVSYVLVGLPQLVPLVNISSLLKEIVKRVYEVIDIVIQDCDPDMPNILIKNKYSSNLLRSSRSASPEIHGSVDLECDSPPIRNHKIFNVTCSSFEASWSVNSLQNHSFRAEVYKGKKLVERMETTDMKLTMLNLEAGVMYTMDISYEACGKNITSSRTVKTGEIVDPVTTQRSNLTDNTTTPFSMAEIQAVTSFTKYTEATVLPSSGTQESSTLPVEKALSASQKMNVSEHVRNDSILNSPETATPAPKWWGNVTVSNGTVAEESSTLPVEKALSASQKMNVSEHVRNDSILNSPETATPAPKWWGNVTVSNGTVAEESSTLPAEKALSASQKMNVSEHVRNDSILNSPETATPAPKWWGNVTILNGTVAEELSTLPAEKVLSASQKMNVSGHVRNDSILNSPETATPAPKWWGNVTVSNGTVAEESSTLPAEKALSASQKMNISEHVRNDSILNSPETATPAPKWWGNVTVLNGTVAEELSTLPAEKVLSASQKMNVSGHVRNDSILNSPETATPAPKWWGNVTVSNGTVAEESSTLPAEKALSASQKMNISEHVRNDSILNSPETATPAPKWWGNVTVSNGTVAEERWTTQDQQNSSVTSTPGVSNIETSPFKRNESIVEEGTPGFSVERFENVISLNVTQNPKCHALNHTLDRDIGGNDSSWSDERNSTASPSSFKANISLATDLSANTTFHVLLFEEELLIKKVKTQSSHLNISELKAGTLYTVKIKADLYGNESKTVQRKVKTAAQKFNGMVRIVNLNYSSEFSNSRSEKRQNFSKMFLNEVRTSLPPNILQKMDAGMINISIVSIIPGSIVVNYSLLIPIDMDARNVSGSLLEAFRNSSRFEVDNSSLSISVLSSSLSSGDAQSKEWSSTALPLTDPYTSDPMPSSAGDNFSTSSSRSLENATANTTINKKTINRTSNIHDLPQNSSLINGSSAVSIKEAVQVLCEFEKIVISIKKDFLHQQSIPESSLYLGNPRCNVTSSNSSHVVLHTDWNECETEIQTNTTHTIAKTVLRNDYSSHRIIRHLKISSQIHCTFENNLLTSSGYTSEGIYTIFEDLHGSGHFLTEMRLFIGNSPIPQNFSISGSDNVMIEVGVQTRSKKLNCPVPNTNTIVIANGISNRARFKLKIFSFVNSSVVYLHCKIKICVEIPKSTCRTNCQGFRFWKSGEIIATPKATWGPLHKFSAGLKEEKKSGLGVGYIILIVIGVLVLALGIAGLLVCRYKRKAGTYDFKRRTEYFNYRAFHD